MKQSATTVGPLLTEVWQGGDSWLVPKKFTNTLFGVFSLSKVLTARLSNICKGKPGLSEFIGVKLYQSSLNLLKNF